MIQLFDHQSRFVEIAKANPRYGWWASCGVGKTIAMLSLCGQVPMRTLVVCPKSIMRTAWARDAATMGMPISVIWSASRPKRLAMIAAPWTLAVTNFATFRNHHKDFMAAGIRRLIVDESSAVKDAFSQISRCVHALSDQCQSVYCLSATPAPNSPVEYFSQLRTLGRAWSGNSFYGFENRYTVPVRRKIMAGGREREVTVGHNQTPHQKQALTDLLAKCSQTLRKEDCLTLPKQTDIVVPVELSDDERRIYDGIADTLRMQLGGETLSIKAGAVLIKLRQATGGTIKANGEAVTIGSSKLEVLDELLDQIGPSEPCVIWAEFCAESDAIVAMCKKRGETVATVDGRTSDVAAETVASFQAGKIQRLVCHPAAAGHGITLHRASYAIYYSLGFSLEQHVQSRDRIHRIGQDRPCTYYLLTATDTVDQASLRVIKRKGTVMDSLRAALAKGDATPCVVGSSEQGQE